MKLLRCLFLLFALFSVAASAKQPVNFANADFEALLKQHNLPGLSVAVVENYEVAFIGSYGKKEYGAEAYINQHTAFGAASISKVITAIIATQLSEQSRLNLDVPVNNYLRRWKLPENKYTTEQPVTLRHLLSHSGGVNQSGYSAYFTGDDIPTLVESLNGKKLKKPADPITVQSPTGSRFSYSGGGFVIAQMVIEDVVGQPIAQIAQDMIFEPIGMTNSTLQQYGSPNFPKNVAKAHNFDGTLAGGTGLPIYPQVAAAGMWTTPTDMAKLIIDFQRALRHESGTVISSKVARETTKVQTLKKAGGWGLGWMRYMADGNLEWFSHSGYGSGFGGQVMATMEGGQAIIIFGNGAHKSRVPVIESVISSIISERNWGREINGAKIASNKSQHSDMVGHYYNINRGFFSPFNETVTVFVKNGRLLLDNSFGTRMPYELLPTENGRYRIDQFVSAEIGLYKGNIAFFHKDADQPATALTRITKDIQPPFVHARNGGYKVGLNAYKSWVAAYPNTLLTRAATFERLATHARDEGRKQEAITFYQLGLHFNPDNETFQAGLSELKVKKQH